LESYASDGEEEIKSKEPRKSPGSEKKDGPKGLRREKRARCLFLRETDCGKEKPIGGGLEEGRGREERPRDWSKRAGIKPRGQKRIQLTRGGEEGVRCAETQKKKPGFQKIPVKTSQGQPQ